MSQIILDIQHVNRFYHLESQELHVLKDVSFQVLCGSSVAVVGSSGSGKSTLLGLCAGLDKIDSGSIRLCGEDLGSMNEDERAALRGRQVGFIFQNFQLMSTLTALENVMVPAELLGAGGRETASRARQLLEEVGLGDRLKHYPAQLSGGEQQRVAIARAFINNPAILFADEPTGNLDGETGKHIEDSLFKMNELHGTTLVLVTHDSELAERCQQRILLKNGAVAGS
jgi:putative ABC transport system ATP-binding protein